MSVKGIPRALRVMLQRRRSFLLGIAGLAAMGAGFVVVSATSALSSHPEYWVRRLLGSLGDAFVIAALLAFLADPLIQRRFASEWGRDLFWAFFNPNAPQEFREAL